MANAGGKLNIQSKGAIAQSGDMLAGTGLLSIDAGAGAVTPARAIGIRESIHAAFVCPGVPVVP
jgi:hypothetical protein